MERCRQVLGFTMLICPMITAGTLPSGVLRAELEEAWVIEVPHLVEPSGLVWRDGTFYTVSDDHDGQIFRLTLGEGVAAMRTAISFSSPDGSAPLDLEGIACFSGGDFLLVAEAQHRTVRVTPSGGSSWYSPSAWDVARAATLFTTPNAYFEALTILPDGSLLMAAERQPRGLVLAEQTSDGAWQMEAWRMNQTRFGELFSLPRRPDFTGLSVDASGRVFALFRSAHLIVELERAGTEEEGFLVGRAWSFAHVENDPRFAYERDLFGQAEGLVVREGVAYVIVDNNGMARASDAQDRRPVLFALRLPTGEDAGFEP